MGGVAEGLPAQWKAGSAAGEGHRPSPERAGRTVEDSPGGRLGRSGGRDRGRDSGGRAEWPADWLYARIYCDGGDDTDALLPEVARWLEEVRGRWPVSSAHFLRFVDVRGHHIRLRIQAGADVLDEIFAHLGGLDRACRRVPARTLERLVVDPLTSATQGRAGVSCAVYGPEYAKYGGRAGVVAAERHFDLSSRWCLEGRVWEVERPEARVALAARYLALAARGLARPARSLTASEASPTASAVVVSGPLSGAAGWSPAVTRSPSPAAGPGPVGSPGAAGNAGPVGGLLPATGSPGPSGESVWQTDPGGTPGILPEDLLAAHLRRWGPRLPARLRDGEALGALVGRVLERCPGWGAAGRGGKAGDGAGSGDGAVAGPGTPGGHDTAAGGAVAAVADVANVAEDAARTAERISAGLPVALAVARALDLLHMDLNRIGVNPAEECVAGVCARYLVKGAA